MPGLKACTAPSPATGIVFQIPEPGPTGHEVTEEIAGLSGDQLPLVVFARDRRCRGRLLSKTFSPRAKYSARTCPTLPAIAGAAPVTVMRFYKTAPASCCLIISMVYRDRIEGETTCLVLLKREHI